MAHAVSLEPFSAATAGAHVPAARIGPNAIIQVAHVLRDRVGATRAERLLYESTGYALQALPSAMVDEREAQALSRAVVDDLGLQTGTTILREAGHRTGDYLLAHRIPKAAQWIMRVAPRRVGLAILLKAMRANAWTFAGSGAFGVEHVAGDVHLTFHACAMCRDMREAGPVCDFYAGTFERLIRVLVSPRAKVIEVECEAMGGHCCRFEVHGIH